MAQEENKKEEESSSSPSSEEIKLMQLEIEKIKKSTIDELTQLGLDAGVDIARTASFTYDQYLAKHVEKIVKYKFFNNSYGEQWTILQALYKMQWRQAVDCVEVFIAEELEEQQQEQAEQ